MDEASFAFALLFWALAPGLAVAGALGLPWTGVERVAAAAGLSIAVVAAAAHGAELAGLPVTPPAVAAVTFAACAFVLVVRRRAGAGAADSIATALPPSCPPPSPRWAPWLVLILPLVVVRQLEPIWSGGLLLPPTLHDGLDHANWFRLILETHSVSPSEVLAPPLHPDGSATYYPWGLHAWLALVAGSTTLEPMTVFLRALVAVSAVMPLSVYVFAAWFTGRGWPAMAAATLSLLFWWLPYQTWGWGGYALLAGAVAALPVSRLALDAVRSRRAIAMLFAGGCGAGLLVVHPSQALGALLICATVSVTLAAGRAGAWRDTLPFLLAVAATAGLFAFGGSLWEPLQAFLDRARSVSANAVRDPAFDWPSGVYASAVWQLSDAGGAWLGALYVIGALVALRHAVLRALVAVHVVFSLMISVAALETWLTSLWYHSPERIWYLQYACLPVLGAIGFAGVFQIADWITRSRLDLRGRQALLWPAALLAFMAAFHGHYAGRGDNFLWFFANRSRPMMPTDQRLLEDFRWMQEHIPEGEVVFNASADWGLPLPFTGRRTVFWSGGYAIDPSTNWTRLLELLNRGEPHTSYAARELDAMGLRYVYALAADPRLAIDGRVPLSATTLETSAALERLYASQTAAVFRVRHDTGERLGLASSERIEFIEGFWGAERSPTRSWRWTNGSGRIRILPDRPAPGACFVRLLGPEPDAYTVRLDGATLPVTPRGHQLPPDASASGVELEIVSEASNPVETGTGTDDRLLGIRVFDIILDCG